MRPAAILLIVVVLSCVAPVLAPVAVRAAPVTVQLLPPPLPIVVTPSGPRAAGGLTGIVLGETDSIVRVLTPDNAIVTVLVTGTTVLLGSPTFPRLSIVEVSGSRNSDGSLTARTIRVLFHPGAALRVSGRIARREGGVLVLQRGGRVWLTGSTWLVRGNSLRPLSALAPGVQILVLGTEGPSGIIAQVIEISS